MGPIGLAFEEAARAGRGLLFPEIVFGYPDPRTSMKALEYLASQDHVVIKLPTPVATGHPGNTNAVIIEAHRRALEAGWTPERVVQRLGLYRPNFLVVYEEALLGGPEAFLDSCAGYIDGCIFAEGFTGHETPMWKSHLTAERAAEYSKKFGLDIARIVYAGQEQSFAEPVKSAQGLVYLAMAAQTGGPMASSQQLSASIKAIRAIRHIPVMGGFGVNSPEKAREVMAAGLDGLTVGTWLLESLSRGFLHFKRTADALWEAMGK